MKMNNEEYKQLCELQDKKLRAIKEMLNEVIKTINKKEFYL